jgi:CheY-like chemotaxis protein
VHRRLVLVVDDDPATGALVAAVLRDEPDLTARVVDRAEQVPRAIEELRPALVLLDLAMPGVDGFELARRLRAGPATAGLPLVAMTALGTADAEARARAAGCDAVLGKPFDIDALVDVVRRHARRPPA